MDFLQTSFFSKWVFQKTRFFFFLKLVLETRFKKSVYRSWILGVSFWGGELASYQCILIIAKIRYPMLGRVCWSPHPPASGGRKPAPIPAQRNDGHPDLSPLRHPAPRFRMSLAGMSGSRVQDDGGVGGVGGECSFDYVDSFYIIKWTSSQTLYRSFSHVDCLDQSMDGSDEPCTLQAESRCVQVCVIFGQKLALQEFLGRLARFSGKKLRCAGCWVKSGEFLSESKQSNFLGNSSDFQWET